MQVQVSSNGSKLRVMAGLVPAIHVLVLREGADAWTGRARFMPGHDDGLRVTAGRVYSAALLAAFANFFITRSRFSFDR